MEPQDDAPVGQEAPDEGDGDLEYAPPPITGEALLAVTGIREILQKEPKRITVAMKERAEMLPREIRRAVKRFLADDAGARRSGKVEPFDYTWALDHITEAMEPRHVEALSKAFRDEDHALGADYLVVAQKVVAYLQGILPIRTETTMAKSISLDPSDTEIARFRRAFDVANDPMIVLRDMERGTLVSDQVRHLAACYPSGYALMKARMAAGMADELTRKKSWRLSYRKDRLVQVLYGTSTWSPGLAKDLQASFAATDKPQQGPAPARGNSKAASALQTGPSKISDGAA